MTEMIPAWIDGRLQEVEKLEVHRRGLRHKAISVFVMDGEKVLIQQRALSKYHTPGLWANTCCTHPYWNETGLACAERRLDEELGISGLTLQPRGIVEYRAEVGDGLIEHEVVEMFQAEMSARQRFVPNPLEVADTTWVAVADLQKDVRRRPERYTPWLSIYLSDHAETIFGAEAPALV